MRLLLVLIASLALSNLHAQSRCATAERTLRAAAADPEYQQSLAAFEALSARFEAGLMDEALRDGPKQVDIPVVVHVLYREEEDNISYEQILGQIEALNQNFAWETNDKHKIPEVWRGLGRATGFRFHLADRDPDGNFTHGVTRTYTSIPGIGELDFYYQSDKGGVDPWPQAHYLNIWVCEINNSTLGFSILPSSSMAANDGIVMAPRAFGTMGSAEPPYDGGRTLVHEVGHYFGLRHTWGADENSCTSTDYMSDTPWQRSPNHHCASFPHISCPSESNGDMFMNYMDYANDSCMLLFTERQVSFMQLVLRTNRVTLLHSQGYTGVKETEAPAGMKVYPNPSSGMVYIEFETGQLPEQVGIVNIVGEQVRVLYPRSMILQADLRDLPRGVYFLTTPQVSGKIVLR